MSNIEESRVARALRAAHRAGTSEIWEKVLNILSCHPCVAYGFSIEWGEDESDCVWSESESTSVELLQIAIGKNKPHHGRLSSNRRAQWGADEIARGLEAVAECVSLVQNIHIPFTLLVHVPGQTGIGVYFNSRFGNAPSFRALAEELRFLLEILTREFEELNLI